MTDTVTREDALNMLAKLVNRASRTQKTDNPFLDVVQIPAELMKQARDLFEPLRDESKDYAHASNRVF